MEYVVIVKKIIDIVLVEYKIKIII